MSVSDSNSDLESKLELKFKEFVKETRRGNAYFNSKEEITMFDKIFDKYVNEYGHKTLYKLSSYTQKCNTDCIWVYLISYIDPNAKRTILIDNVEYIVIAHFYDLPTTVYYVIKADEINVDKPVIYNLNETFQMFESVRWYFTEDLNSYHLGKCVDVTFPDDFDPKLK